MKPVIYVLQDFDEGGVQRVSLKLLNEFVKYNKEVTLVVLKGNASLAPNLNSEVKLVLLNNKKVLTSAFDLLKFLFSSEVSNLVSSIVQVNILVACLNMFLGMKHVHMITEHTHSTLASKYAERRNLKFSYFLQKLFYPLANKITCVSRGISVDLVARVPAIKGKVSVIYNPVIDDNFNIMAAMPVDVDFARFIKGNKVVLGVGRLVTMKDFELLIDGFSALIKNTTNIVLVIIGDGPLRNTLQEKVNGLGISKYVKFMGHLVNPLPYYRYADVFALTSKYEGFGLVLVEALALSKNIVSIDCECGPREILGGVSSLLETRDPESLAIEFNRALMNPGDRASMTARASDFNVQLIARKYMNEFV